MRFGSQRYATNCGSKGNNEKEGEVRLCGALLGRRGWNLSFLDVFGLCIICRVALIIVARDSVLSALDGIVHIGLCFIDFTILVRAVISGRRLLFALCGTTQKESFSDDCFCACYTSQHLPFGYIDVFDESRILPACPSVLGRVHHLGGVTRPYCHGLRFVKYPLWRWEVDHSARVPGARALGLIPSVRLSLSCRLTNI